MARIFRKGSEYCDPVGLVASSQDARVRLDQIASVSPWYNSKNLFGLVLIASKDSRDSRSEKICQISLNRKFDGKKT